MGRKNYPSWIKGGIIVSGGILLLNFLLWVIAELFFKGDMPGNFMFLIPSFTLFIPLVIFSFLGVNVSWIISTIIMAILWFLIGSLIGKLYKKS